ncbi:MAG: hypothetical protein WAK55_08415 [Xanthobacteraceae bacterium]
MKEYDFYENAVVRMLDRHRFPTPWSVEEASFCFVVLDHNGQAFAHVYCDDNPTAKLLTREEARHIATKVATLPARIVSPPKGRPN